jgi:N-methylhydantoinase A
VVRVPIPRKRYSAEDIEAVNNAFDEWYERLYGKGAGYSRAGRFITSFTVHGTGRIPKPVFAMYEEKGPDASGSLKGKRDAFFRKYNAYVSTNIYDYEKLGAGNVIEGPAIIEAEQTSVVIPPDFRGIVDEYLNIRIRIKKEAT